jgi:hypothetical protein
VISPIILDYVQGPVYGQLGSWILKFQNVIGCWDLSVMN